MKGLSEIIISDIKIIVLKAGSIIKMTLNISMKFTMIGKDVMERLE